MKKPWLMRRTVKDSKPKYENTRSFLKLWVFLMFYLLVSQVML